MTILQALAITAPLAIRTRCAWCAEKHSTDGRGPILAGELVSDGACDVAFAVMMAELDTIEEARATR